MGQEQIPTSEFTKNISTPMENEKQGSSESLLPLQEDPQTAMHGADSKNHDINISHNSTAILIPPSFRVSVANMVTGDLLPNVEEKVWESSATTVKDLRHFIAEELNRRNALLDLEEEKAQQQLRVTQGKEFSPTCSPSASTSSPSGRWQRSSTPLEDTSTFQTVAPTSTETNTSCSSVSSPPITTTPSSRPASGGFFSSSVRATTGQMQDCPAGTDVEQSCAYKKRQIHWEHIILLMAPPGSAEGSEDQDDTEQVEDGDVDEDFSENEDISSVFSSEKEDQQITSSSLPRRAVDDAGDLGSFITPCDGALESGGPKAAHAGTTSDSPASASDEVGSALRQLGEQEAMDAEKSNCKLLDWILSWTTTTSSSKSKGAAVQLPSIDCSDVRMKVARHKSSSVVDSMEVDSTAVGELSLSGSVCQLHQAKNNPGADISAATEKNVLHSGAVAVSCLLLEPDTNFAAPERKNEVRALKKFSEPWSCSTKCGSSSEGAATCTTSAGTSSGSSPKTAIVEASSLTKVSPSSSLTLSSEEELDPVDGARTERTTTGDALRKRKQDESGSTKDALVGTSEKKNKTEELAGGRAAEKASRSCNILLAPSVAQTDAERREIEIEIENNKQTSRLAAGSLKDTSAIVASASSTVPPPAVLSPARQLGPPPVFHLSYCVRQWKEFESRAELNAALEPFRGPWDPMEPYWDREDPVDLMQQRVDEYSEEEKRKIEEEKAKFQQIYGPLRVWDVSKIQNFASLFSRRPLFNCDISGWDTSSAVDMHCMFSRAFSFNRPLNDWDVSKVVDMAGMFHEALRFNQDLSNWDVSSVETMKAMFMAAEKFDQKVSSYSWDVSRVQTMQYMFNDAYAFHDGDLLEQWEPHFLRLFGNCTQKAIGDVFHGSKIYWTRIQFLTVGHA
ncbi:unnamed protein product [Amoebophrya sp. A120]|nr:unnamed protein product [Amoebophrya sp. A120]|eukprot:GSA120T00021356001.1